MSNNPELNRVSQNIAHTVKMFFIDMKEGQRFTMRGLRVFVCSMKPATYPESPSRIARKLKKDQVLGYTYDPSAKDYIFNGFF